MKLITKPKKEYSEIEQSKKIQFSFVNKIDQELYMLFYWVNCRDFLSDVLIAEEENIKVREYGFNYDSTIQKIDRDKTRLAIKTNNKYDAENIEKNIIILHYIEEINNIPKTTLTKIKTNRYLFEGDPFWQSTTFTLHLYTYLIKVMGYAFIEPLNWEKELDSKYQWYIEQKYLRDFFPEYKTILYGKLKEVFVHPTTVDGWSKEIDNINFKHNNSGILSLFSKYANNTFIKNNEYYKRMQKVLQK